MSPLKFSCSLATFLAQLFLFPVAGPAAAQSVVTSIKSSIHDVGVRFVSNSGICETTPGVNQMSGYIDIGTNMSLWFWFFEARESPETAPFTLWLNGGPGSPSMVGLFQENGPCTVVNDTCPDGETIVTKLNQYSWNNVSNMIYIDQPIGTGFSHGSPTANSTQTAAQLMWNAFQVLFKNSTFAVYRGREFILATESYGGHYGPAFVTYFLQQNELIQSGALEGEEIIISALMINNGWIDPLIQYKAYIDFAANAPGYGQLLPSSTIKEMNDLYFNNDSCQTQGKKCYTAGTSIPSNQICNRAEILCNRVSALINKNDSLNLYDLRRKASETFPSTCFVKYLNLLPVREAIGAEVAYDTNAAAVRRLFTDTGDNARTLLPQLAALADTGLKILIWAGDADISCNWVGLYEAILAMDWREKAALNEAVFTNMTLNGTPVAAFMNVDNFSFARVYDAGHKIPAYKPEAALEIFKQVIKKEPLHSV